MDSKNSTSPFRPLGKKLKAMRDKAKETLAEASGAVEIDVRQLASYELGQARPSEDVLLLLISHFGVMDDEAVKIWELAGYTNGRTPIVHMVNDDPQVQQVGLSADSSRIMFTDIVDVVVNNYGVVMNFMQGSGPANKPSTVARVGMSREHAKSVLQILQVTLAQTERFDNVPKKLSAPDVPQAD
jgi:transcriptional regulator with XRE-family HTH domain